MLLRNSLWNLTGSALPALVALATVPLMIRGLGLEGFGLVTLITSIVGYFGILDVNLSAGSIKYLAEHHARRDSRRFAETFWFGLSFYGLLGIGGGLLLFLFAAPLLARFFNVSPLLIDDTLLALKIAAVGFALSQVQNYLIVVPQALQRYDRSARSEAFFGITANLVSAVVAVQGGGIAGVVLARASVSLLNVLWLIILLNRLGVALAPALPSREVCSALARFSGYTYLSRLSSMLHQHADKLIVGSLAGPVALAFYSVPNQLASRILGLSFRLSSVIYPRVSALAATGEQHQLRSLYLDTTRLLTYLNCAVLCIIALTGEAFLARWVGPAFVTEGYPILLLITFALLTDSLTVIPSLVNDGLGHPRITGRFALARGLIGVPMVYAGTVAGGIIGAAAAHVLASLLMTGLFLAFVHGRTVPIRFGETLRECWLPGIGLCAAVMLLVLPLTWLLPDTLSGLLLLAATSGLLLGAAGLAFIVRTDERAALLSVTRRLVPGVR